MLERMRSTAERAGSETPRGRGVLPGPGPAGDAGGQPAGGDPRHRARPRARPGLPAHQGPDGRARDVPRRPAAGERRHRRRDRAGPRHRRAAQHRHRRSRVPPRLPPRGADPRARPPAVGDQPGPVAPAAAAASSCTTSSRPRSPAPLPLSDITTLAEGLDGPTVDPGYRQLVTGQLAEARGDTEAALVVLPRRGRGRTPAAGGPRHRPRRRRPLPAHPAPARRGPARDADIAAELLARWGGWRVDQERAVRTRLAWSRPRPARPTCSRRASARWPR